MRLAPGLVTGRAHAERFAVRAAIAQTTWSDPVGPHIAQAGYDGREDTY